MNNINVTLERLPNKIAIHINDEVWGYIHSSIFGKINPFSTHYNDLNQFEEAFHHIEKKMVLQYVLKRLAAQNLSSMELEKKLKLRFVSASAIQHVISKCQEMGLINDVEWVASMVRRLLAKRNGPQAILMKLLIKGVPKILAEEAMEKADTQENQLQRVHELLSTRFRAKDLSCFKERNKIIAALMRKGFSFDLIQQAITQKVTS